MKPSYRVLHVIDHLGSGGAQETLLSLVKYADRRFQVEAATLHGRGYYWERLRRLGAPVHSLSPHKYLPLYVPRLLKLLRAGKFDLVHCHLTAANLIAKPLARCAGVPYIFNCDQNDMYRPRQPLRRWLDALANRITDHIVAVSESTRDFLVQREGAPLEKITVIYNGVDLERFQPAGEASVRAARRAQWSLPEAAPVVAGVGRLSEQKNFPLFLRVAREVLEKMPQVHFAMAGEGPDRAGLEGLARDLGIANQVHFLGYVHDMTEFYPVADLLLMTSRAEGTPLTVLEAMAMGVPMVGTRVDGQAEVLEDGVDGYLADPEDLPRLVERTLRLLQEPETAGRLAAAARAKVQREYSAEVMVQRTEALYLRYLEP